MHICAEEVAASLNVFQSIIVWFQMLLVKFHLWRHKKDCKHEHEEEQKDVRQENMGYSGTFAVFLDNEKLRFERVSYITDTEYKKGRGLNSIKFLDSKMSNGLQMIDVEEFKKYCSGKLYWVNTKSGQIFPYPET
jgi:hypothetical protein